MPPRAVTPDIKRLARAALPDETIALARFLLGKIVVRDTDQGRMTGRIVETEAYLPGDAAAHGFRGETKRNASLFKGKGHAYIYLAYGTSMMLNVSSDRAGVGAGVLIRALEPLTGIHLMQLNRPHAKGRQLTAGPGRLCAALDIDLALDGVPLWRPGPLWLADDGGTPLRIAESVRIGITKNADAPWRFFDPESPYISGPRRLNRP